MYKIRYLPVFYDDLYSAASYIARELSNPAAAERLVDNVEKAIVRRAEYPLSFQPYTLEHKQPYYSINVGNYMVFYIVTDDVMEVRRFIYGPRDISRIL